MNNIELIPKSSRLFLSILFVLHILALLTIGLSNINVIFKLLLGLLLLISGYYFFYYVGLQHASKTIVKCLHQNDEWILFDRSGKEYVVQLSSDTLITPFLIILNFRVISNKKHKSIVLFKDSLPTNIFRQLQVLLHLKQR